MNKKGSYTKFFTGSVKLIQMQSFFILSGLIFFIRRLKLKHSSITFEISTGADLRMSIIKFFFENFFLNFAYFLILMLLLLPYYMLSNSMRDMIIDFIAFYVIFLCSYLISIISFVLKENKIIFFIISLLIYSAFIGINILLKFFQLIDPFIFLLINILITTLVLFYIIKTPEIFIQNYFLALLKKGFSFIPSFSKSNVKFKVYLMTFIFKLRSLPLVTIAVIIFMTWIYSIIFNIESRIDAVLYIAYFSICFLLGHIFMENIEDFNFKYFKTTSVSFFKLSSIFIISHLFIVIGLFLIFLIAGILFDINPFTIAACFAAGIFTTISAWLISFFFMGKRLLSEFYYTFLCVAAIVLNLTLPKIYFIFVVLIPVLFYGKAKFNFDDYTTDQEL